MPVDTILMPDLKTYDKCSALSTDEYNYMYVGEGTIREQRSDGLYTVDIDGCRNPPARPVFNAGENVFPIGILVFVIVYKGQGYILGRMRPVNDEDESDGSTSIETSPNIGTQGDALMKPHATTDRDPAFIRVTRGGVITIKTTSATSLALHPHNNMFKWSCQRLQGFSEAYRIESGKSSGKKGALKPDALTEQTYVDKIGSSRNEIRVYNGKVDGSIVHHFSISDLNTAAGRTLGNYNFRWDIESDGTWDIKNVKEVNVGDSVDEPVVLGNQMVSMTTDILSVIKDIIGALRELRTELVTALLPIGAAATSAVSMVSTPTPITNAGAIAAIGSVMGPMFATTLPLKLNTLIAKLIPIEAANEAVKKTYLTSAGPVREKVLSDFFNSQKTAPIVKPIAE